MSSPSSSSRKQTHTTMSGTSPNNSNSNHAHPSPSSTSSSSTPSSNLFPVKLHRLLAWTEEKENSDQYSHIIYWMPDGKSFRIADKEGLITHVLPATEWFGGNGSPQIQSYKSFHRNLNLWEFKTASKTTVGIPRGAIYHPLFQKGRMDLVQGMTRINKRLNPQRKFVRKTASPSASPLKQHVRPLPPKSILATTSSSSSHLPQPSLRSPTVPLQAEDILQRGRTRGISTSSGSTVSTAALSPSPALHTPTTTAIMAAPTIAEEVASAVVSIDNNHQRTSSSSLENTTSSSSRGDTIPHVMFLEAGAAQVLGSLRGIAAGKEEEDHD